jgi:hypothetical protein
MLIDARATRPKGGDEGTGRGVVRVGAVLGTLQAPIKAPVQPGVNCQQHC